MTDDPRFDLDIHKKDILDLASPDGVAAFFARLHYDVSPRTAHTATSLGISEAVARPVRRIELLADRDLFQVYLVELTSVTVASTRALVRSFRDRGGDFLFVITSGDYGRLDFVFLDRLAENFTSPTIGSTTVGVRPRALTVDRRNPSTIALRVLRRFTWTEPDRFAQADKIRSAYALAEWSEEEGLFNNRALFSDHYLKSRLREDAVWGDDTSGAGFREFRDLLIARRTTAAADEASLRTTFFEPALTTLGFISRAVQREPNDLQLADYELLASPASAKPVALCLTYPWMRYLDGKDSARDTETPEENPGAVVVSLLQKRDIPWVIVTNGKLWRLYSKRTHSRATSYFEIDLEEVIAEATRASSDPFRYFWVLFRRSAFEEVSITREGREERIPFLDRLLLESEDYAKELGERLKERIFERVFPHLAEGFVSRWDGQPSEEDLQQTYRATLTLLYRLLFLLYAEARDLLPVREVRGYYEKSLAKLKREIADAAGALDEEIEAKLKKALDPDSTALYARLSELFSIIDVGSTDLNVPFYNGGLFSTSPPSDDVSEEADAARFLRDHAVPDRQLAAAIDLLSREEDRADRIFIDYKSLGVRHLGSIYEGLLEFRLRFALERLGIVREKSRDVYKPWRDLDDKKKAQLERDGRFINRGRLYLENDKHERKATGSYYTPDYIVKYIIEHAVGPTVKEKLDALRPRLRKAQEWHRTASARSRAKGETVDRNYDYGTVVEQEWHSLIDDVFDIKVLDPAMGSGHFLVEAVDFITDHVLDFLNAFPWNPVTAHLRFTRDQILKSLDDQKVSVDAGKLTDVNLLKRHVLKRCIYGVDLNPMAVELAKVSLWLDCFTLGAPLSFLDHHLRCGNSLVGVTVEEVDAKLREGTQAHLFSGNKFAGVKNSVAGMIAIGELPDITPDQVKSSRSEFERASLAISWAKRLLDVYTSQWFGNDAVRTRRGQVNPALEFLGDKASEVWAEGRSAAKLDEPFARVAAVSESARRESRFFHWQLEFPEVFIADSKGSDRGFDAVIGNPPYVRQERLSDAFKHFARERYASFTSAADLYVFFVELALEQVRAEGRFSVITSSKYMRAAYGRPLRDLLLRESSLEQVIDFGELPIFSEAGTFPSIIVAQKGVTKEQSVRYSSVRALSQDDLGGTIERGARIIGNDALRSAGWTFSDAEELQTIARMRDGATPLGEYVNDRIYWGIKTGLNAAFVLDAESADLVLHDSTSKELVVPFLIGDEVREYVCRNPVHFVIAIPKGFTDRHRGRSDPWKWLSSTFPSIAAHLKPFEARASARADQGDYWWELRACEYYHEFHLSKIIYPEMAMRPRFALEPSGVLCNNKTFFIPTDDLYLLGVLNSTLIWTYLKRTCSVLGDAENRGRVELRTVHVRTTPIKLGSAEQRSDVRSLVGEMLKMVAVRRAANIDEPSEQEVVLQHKIDSHVAWIYGV